MTDRRTLSSPGSGYKRGDTFNVDFGNGVTREFTVTGDVTVFGDLTVRTTPIEPPLLKRIELNGRYRAAIDAMVAEMSMQLGIVSEDVQVYLEPGVEIHVVPRGIA